MAGKELWDEKEAWNDADEGTGGDGEDWGNVKHPDEVKKVASADDADVKAAPQKLHVVKDGAMGAGPGPSAKGPGAAAQDVAKGLKTAASRVVTTAPTSSGLSAFVNTTTVGAALGYFLWGFKGALVGGVLGYMLKAQAAAAVAQTQNLLPAATQTKGG
jgi:hypothetical protein